MSTLIDLSRLSPPDVIETLDYEALFNQYRTRFLQEWAAARAIDPTLPDYNVEGLESDPAAAIIGQAVSYLRLLDRARVNDAVKAVLAPLATGTNLDNVVARLGVQRLTVTQATPTAAAVMETDERLLARYLLAFGRPSAGSAARYLYEAYTVWPELHDAAVIGRAIHGRRGDIDLVIAGPGGRDATDDELALVRDAIHDPRVKPEAVAVTVVRAVRSLYTVTGTITVPRGPDADVVRAEAERRVTEACRQRMKVGAEVPREMIAGAAYGPSVGRVELTSPMADIPAHPYAIPVLVSVTLTPVVAS